MRKNFSLVAVIIALSFSVTPVSAETGAADCLALMSSAEKRAQQGDREAAKEFKIAEQVCSAADLSDLQFAQMAALKGDYVLFYQNDTEGAVRIYRHGLSKAPADDPRASEARIHLLDALAGALNQQAQSDNGPSDVSWDASIWDLRTEALELRAKNYGKASPEYVHGLLLAAWHHLPGNPWLAEKYAEQAKELVIAHPELSETEAAGELYSTLGEIYRRQNREEEAARAQERGAAILGRVHSDDGG